MKKIEVFDGNELQNNPAPHSTTGARCTFWGTNNTHVPLDEELLSRHILFLGGIGTGKTNAFFQILKQLRGDLTEWDIIIVFDTKGDFYKVLSIWRYCNQ